MKKTYAGVVAFACCSLPLLGIGACTIEPRRSSEQSSVPADDTTYTVTAVHLNPDGTQTVKYSTVTLTEQIREREARSKEAADPSTANPDTDLGQARDAISQDTGCSAGDIWIYSGANLTGNMICFSGTGIADLCSYTELVFNGIHFYWCSVLQSYWSGYNPGWWQFDSTNDVSCASPSSNSCATFGTESQHDSLSSCESSHHRYVNIGESCNNPTNVLAQSSCPVGDTGSYYTPNGTVTWTMFKNGVQYGSSVNYTADSSGNVSVGMGTPGNGDCGPGYGCSPDETVQLKDVSSGLTATATLFDECY